MVKNLVFKIGNNKRSVYPICVSDTIINMLIFTMTKDLGIENSVQKSIVKKIMNTAVMSTYYIFCVETRRGLTSLVTLLRAKLHIHAYIHILFLLFGCFCRSIDLLFI